MYLPEGFHAVEVQMLRDHVIKLGFVDSTDFSLQSFLRQATMAEQRGMYKLRAMLNVQITVRVCVGEKTQGFNSHRSRKVGDFA